MITLENSGQWAAWRGSFAYGLDRNHNCVLFQANVPFHSNADRIQAATSATVYARSWCKAQNIDYDDTQHRNALHSLGYEVYGVLCTQVSDNIRLKVLEPAKLQYEEDERASRVDDEITVAHPCNLATVCWEALHYHFEPDAVANRAARIISAFQSVIALRDQMTKADPHGEQFLLLLPAAFDAIKAAGDTSDLSLENILTLATASFLVASQHHFQLPAREVMLAHEDISTLTMYTLSRQVEVYRNALHHPASTYAAAAAAAAPAAAAAAAAPDPDGTYRNPAGHLLCKRCNGRASAAHTANTCRTDLSRARNARGARGDRDRDRDRGGRRGNEEKGGGERKALSAASYMTRFAKALDAADRRGAQQFRFEGQVFGVDSVKDESE